MNSPIKDIKPVGARSRHEISGGEKTVWTYHPNDGRIFRRSAEVEYLYDTAALEAARAAGFAECREMAKDLFVDWRDSAQETDFPGVLDALQPAEQKEAT